MIRKIIVFILLAGALWYFYGDTFQKSGVEGVIDQIGSDLTTIKDNPKVVNTVDYFEKEIQLLVAKLQGKSDNLSDSEQPNQPVPDKPQLENPVKQSFSIHNVELGDDRSEVEEQVGSPQRTSLNEYGIDWFAYHDNYHNFFMAAYNKNNKIIGLYTNQNLLTSEQGITFESSRETVLSSLDEPLDYIQKGFVRFQIQGNQEYDTFLIDNNYVTFFYDKHEESTVTAIQLISEEMEQQKEEFFAESSDALKEGFEYQLFDLTNAARVNHGLATLSWEEPVRTTTRDHSKDMADNNYFGHTNLDGLSPFERLDQDGISYKMAGENLAAGQSSSVFAHEGLMNSIGHRENKLKTDFEALAVGVAFNEDSQPFYTENYLKK